MAVRKLPRDKYEPYIKVDHYMMNSAAWTALSDRAIWLFLELKKQFDFSKGGDEYLVLPYSKVAWRMSRNSYCMGMHELVQYGFFRVVQQGGLLRRATVYAASDHWKEVGRQIVDKEGREAVRLGLAPKRRSWNRLANLEGRRIWEKKEHTPGNI